MLTKFKSNIVDTFIDSVANTLSANLSGTITVNTTSTTVTGVSTNFTGELTVSDRIFLGAESRQILTITNTTHLTVASAFNTAYSANTYKKGKLINNNYYVFAARQSPFENDEAVTADLIDNDYEGSTFIHDELMFCRKITSSDILPMINKHVWQANTLYPRYDDKDSELIQKMFFVLTSENKVYKCIQNNNDGRSTVEPTHIELGFPPEESDGYRWQFLYEINNNDFLTFATENYIPVFQNTSVRNAAIDGSIFNFVVEANGSSYPADSGTITTLNNNNYVIQIDSDSSSTNGFFSNCAIIITNDTTNQVYVKEIREYVSNNSGKYAVVKIPFSTGQVTNNQPYIISPFIKMDSKSGSNCVAYAVMQNVSNTTFTGSVEKIEIVNPGKNYRQANVTVQSSTGFGNGAVVRAVISPPGGHGFNVIDELYCQSVGIGVQFSNSASFAHSPDVEFRAVGIIKDPLAANTITGTGTIDLVAESTTVSGTGTYFTSEINVGDFIGFADEEKEVTEITNDSSLKIKSPFSYTVVSEALIIRPKFSGTFFNQTVTVTAANTTPALLTPGEFVVGSDGTGSGSQIMAKVAFANTSTVVLTGLDKDQTRGISTANTFVNDVLITGVGYSVRGAATPTIVASGAKYSKAAGNSSITTIPDVKLYSGEILYIQNVLPIQRSNTTNEQVRLVVTF